MEATVGSALKNARKRRALRQVDVADHVGVSVQAVSQWERGDNQITMENLRTVAAFLKIDATAAYRGEVVLLDDAAPPNEVERVSDVGRPALGPLDVPVLGLTVGGSSGDFSFNGEIIGHVRRPAGIANLSNVFALHVLGDSMSPRYEPGDMVYCGGRPPVPGDDCVIEMLPTEDAPAGRGFIKRLVKRSTSKILVSQFNPSAEIDFDPREVKAVHRVIPWKEVLGF